MRKLIIPAVMAVALAVSSAAFAGSAQHTSTGRIVGIDGDMRTITLEDGSVYHLQRGYRNPALKERETVTITWSEPAGDRVVSNIVIDNYNTDFWNDTWRQMPNG